MHYVLDQDHSAIEFAVRHLGFSTVRGHFTRFSGAVDINDDGVPMMVSATVDVGSVDTRSPARDEHLRSADFFAADEFNTMIFQSTRFTRRTADVYDVDGQLTLRGVTLPITLEATIAGPITDGYGVKRVGASVVGALSRKLWGLTWNQALELGGVTVSDEVKLAFDLQATAAGN